MNGTPRLRSAFPSTPASAQRRSDQDAAFPRPQKLTSAPPSAISPSTLSPEPLIPFHLIDAPSQRLYVLIIYIGLHLWRSYDYFNLVADESESLWLFMKWLAIDSVFLYGLPGFQVPWLQWSSSTTALLVILHTFLDAFLMFRIPVGSEHVLILLCAKLTCSATDTADDLAIRFL